MWATIVSVLLGGAFMAWSMLEKAKEIEDSDEPSGNRVKTLKAMGYTVGHQNPFQFHLNKSLFRFRQVVSLLYSF